MARVRRNVGFDCLGEREHDLRAMLGVAQKQFVIGIAEIARLEQDCRRARSAEHMEGGEAVRLRAQLEPARWDTNPSWST